MQSYFMPLSRRGRKSSSDSDISNPCNTRKLSLEEQEQAIIDFIISNSERRRHDWSVWVNDERRECNACVTVAWSKRGREIRLNADGLPVCQLHLPAVRKNQAWRCRATAVMPRRVFDR